MVRHICYTEFKYATVYMSGFRNNLYYENKVLQNDRENAEFAESDNQFTSGTFRSPTKIMPWFLGNMSNTFISSW